MSKEIRSLIESIKKDQTPPPFVAVEPIAPPSVEKPVSAEEALSKAYKTAKTVERTEKVEKSEKILPKPKQKAAVVPIEETVVAPVAEETAAPKTEPVEVKASVPTENLPKPAKVEKKAKVLAEPSDFETFFSQLNEADFQLEQKTVANIDNRFYEIFMALKRRKKVKNVSLIVNGILKEYIERHKDEIVKTMSEGSLIG